MSGARASTGSQDPRFDSSVAQCSGGCAALCAPLSTGFFSSSLGSPPCYRGRQLEESLEYLEFMQNAEEEEAWISEKEAMVAGGASGDTLATTQVSDKSND